MPSSYVTRLAVRHFAPILPCARAFFDITYFLFSCFFKVNWIFFIMHVICLLSVRYFPYALFDSVTFATFKVRNNW